MTSPNPHYSTLDELILETLERLTMATGIGTQLYAESRIRHALIHKFNVLFDLKWWPAYSAWEEHTLDGSTGVVTSDLSNTVRRLDDIRVIYPEDSATSIPEMPSSINPYTLSGTDPIYYEGFDNSSKLFRIWPLASTGVVQLHRRTYPDPDEIFIVGSSEKLRMDRDALVLGAAYEYLELDGSNPGGTDMFKNMFDARVSDIMRKTDAKETSLNPYNPVVGTNLWREI